MSKGHIHMIHHLRLRSVAKETWKFYKEKCWQSHQKWSQVERTWGGIHRDQHRYVGTLRTSDFGRLYEKDASWDTKWRAPKKWQSWKATKNQPIHSDGARYWFDMLTMAFSIERVLVTLSTRNKDEGGNCYLPHQQARHKESVISREDCHSTQPEENLIQFWGLLCCRALSKWEIPPNHICTHSAPWLCQVWFFLKSKSSLDNFRIQGCLLLFLNK